MLGGRRRCEAGSRAEWLFRPGVQLPHKIIFEGRGLLGSKMAEVSTPRIHFKALDRIEGLVDGALAFAARVPQIANMRSFQALVGSIGFHAVDLSSSESRFRMGMVHSPNRGCVHSETAPRSPATSLNRASETRRNVMRSQTGHRALGSRRPSSTGGSRASRPRVPAALGGQGSTSGRRQGVVSERLASSEGTRAPRYAGTA
jgi:hypothetical protein